MLPKQPMNGSGPRTIVIRFFLVVVTKFYVLTHISLVQTVEFLTEAKRNTEIF